MTELPRAVSRAQVELVIRDTLIKLTDRLRDEPERVMVIDELVAAVNELAEHVIAERVLCTQCGRSLYVQRWTCNRCEGSDHARAIIEIGSPLGSGYQSVIETVPALIYREIPPCGTPS
jgi:hypothetical protein